MIQSVLLQLELLTQYTTQSEGLFILYTVVSFGLCPTWSNWYTWVVFTLPLLTLYLISGRS